MLSDKKKKQVNKLIYETAYEIEQRLSDLNYFEAKMYGIPIYKIPDVALGAAVKYIKNKTKETIEEILQNYEQEKSENAV